MKKIYFNGTIIPMTGADDRLEAVLTEGDKILFAGKRCDAEKFLEREASPAEESAAVEYVDLKGRTMLPGFVDGHSHFFQTAQGMATCDLSGAECFADIVALLQDYIKENQITSDDVVFGGGYDHNFLKEETHPDRNVLDQASDTVPIYISHTSGHMGAANSALLTLAGIIDETPDPKGGRFGRDAEGHLTGYVEETPALMQILASCMSKMKIDMPKQIKAAQELYFSYGVTTAQEGAASGQALQGLAAIAASGLLNMDVVVYVLSDEYEETARKMQSYVGSYKDHVKLAGSKIILDGSPQGKSAWLSRPYEGETEYCGYPTHEDDYVENAVRQSVRSGVQILAHCNGDAASEQFLNSCEKVMQEEKKEDLFTELRPVMVHCQTVREDQLDRMKSLDMIPSVFVGHTYYWGDIHLQNLGEERGKRISPVRSMQERGLVYNFHQDTPVTKPDMLHSVWCAVNRITRKGKSIGAEQCIDVYSALKAVTIHAAYAYHEEDKKGTIEEGKQADFVILDQNPLETEKREIDKIKVVQTVKSGETVYCAD